MGRVKPGWIYLLLAVLITAGLSAALVFAYFSEEGWTAFGVVGTWLTGGLAALIAYIQFREQKLRQAELIFKSTSSVKNSASMLSESMLNLFIFINDEAESLLERDSSRQRKISYVYFFKGLTHYCSLVKKISIDSYQKNYLSHEMANDIEEVNNDVDVFMKQAKSLVSEERNYPGCVFAVLDISVIVNEITSHIIKSINPENPYQNLVREQSERSLEIMKLKSQKDFQI